VDEINYELVAKGENLQTQHSPIGVFVFEAAKPNAVHCTQNAPYITEILSHAGVPFRPLTNLPEALNDELKILLTAGDGALDKATQSALENWIERGGQWLSLGGLCGLEEVHGARVVAYGTKTRPMYYPQTNLGEGYLKPSGAHPITGGAPIPLHFYNGVRFEIQSESAQVLATILDSHGRETNAPALLENECGKGRCVLLAPDSIGAVVRIQQGTTITADGVPAPDGSGPTTDGVLKCDDGLVLDWHFDREEIPGTNGMKGFMQPIADLWRELILRAIFYLCEKAEVAIPVLWLYPRNLPAMAHLSHDTDANDLHLGEKMLEVVAQAEIHSTWCTILPGYPREFMEKIKAAGHELSIHYNALDHPWSEEEFAAQCRELRTLFGETPVSNKNHYTRWEGGTEFFDWCAREEIWIEQSKGPSKPGEIGFTFGSAQLHFPLADNGEIHTVLEQPLHSQDFIVVSPPELLPPLLAAVEKHHGVLHLLFHPAHIAKDGVADALLSAVQQAKERGLEWQTARWFNDWERARRSVQWKQIEAAAATPGVLMTPLAESTILVLGKHEQLQINGEQRTAQTTMRWGFEFSFAMLD
jgi:hypothetical protein